MKSKWLAIFFAVSYIGVFAVIGLLVAYIGFCDPDTCWHLALGKWIYQHQALPMRDVFSTNVFAMVHVSDRLPLMQHEWFSDLLFYSVFASSGARGLLVFTALLATLSLGILPAILLRRNNVPRAMVIVLTIAATLASGFRMWVRPEQFSFLCLSSLALIQDFTATATGRRALGICISFTFAIMVLWTNMHALFLVGIAYCLLLVCTGFLSGDDYNLVGRRTAIFISAALATLSTPWGSALWSYMMRLLGSSYTHTNKENGPITFHDLTHPTFIPLLLFEVIVWTILVLRHASTSVGALRRRSEPLLLALAGTLLVLFFRRLTPLGLIVMYFAIARSYNLGNEAVSKPDEPEPAVRRWLRQLDMPLGRLGMPGSWLSSSACLLTAAIVCLATSWFMVAPAIPAPSRLFVPPVQALQYLEENQPAGRILNDSKYGSMMTWCMNHPPDIFIDGRFDSFDRTLIADYNSMRLCRPGWRHLLDKYKIRTVFFPAAAPIVLSLKEDAGWHVEFADSDSVILRR
ncbi:MAG TPA: hypothetical protein V6C86_13905 [Oculatellaceae cyanobacterium]